MKRITLLVLILLLTVVLMTACQLPARTDQPVPTAGGLLSSPQAQPPAQEVTPQAPQESPTAQPASPTAVPAADTPVPTPAVVTSTPAPTEPQPEATATNPPAAATATPAVSANRIQFRTGATSATLSGELSAGQTEHYILQASSGQTMRLNVWSPNGDVHLGVEGAAGQKLLETTSRTTSFSASLPATQDYLIHLTASGGATSYQLTVEIPAGTAQPAPTGAPAQPTATLPAGAFDPNTLGRPRWVDDMNAGSRSNWASPPDGPLPDTDNIRLSISNDRFYVTGKQPGFKTWWFSWPSITDAYVELTVESGECAGKDAYGLILRGPQHQAGVSRGYVVAFACDGSYQVTRIDSADPFTEVILKDWTSSDPINEGPNQSNILGVRLEGSRIAIYANGQRLTELNDATYREGRIGLYVGASSTRNYTYRAVRLAYWNLE
jgi:hypothetical protein